MKKTDLYDLIKQGRYEEAAFACASLVPDKTPVTGPDKAFALVKQYANVKQESFYIILLDGAHQATSAIAVTVGIVDKTIVHPREVFRPAIVENASAVIIAHNHPSGKLEPSNEDKSITKRLIDAGEILGIQVLDHLIFGASKGQASYVSMQELGLMS